MRLHQTILFRVFLILLNLPMALATSAAMYGLFRNHLLKDYDLNIRPGGFRNPAQIYVRLSPLSLVEAQEARGEARLQFGIDFRWHDERLIWNLNMTSYFPNSTLPYDGPPIIPNCLLVPMRQIWAPWDIQYVFVLEQELELSEEAYVCNDGTVTTVAFVTFSAPLEFHTKNFPFDQQEVVVVFGHRFVGLQEVNVSLEEKHWYETPHELFHAAWILKGYNCQRHVQLNPGSIAYAIWPYIRCILTIRRDPGYYVINFCAPSVAVTVLAVIGIHSAISRDGKWTSKYELSTVTLLSTSVQLLSISQAMPRAGTVSRFHLFYSGLTGAVILSALSAWGTMKLDMCLKRCRWIVCVLDRLSLISILGGIVLLLTWFLLGVEDEELPADHH